MTRADYTFCVCDLLQYKDSSICVIVKIEYHNVEMITILDKSGQFFFDNQGYVASCYKLIQRLEKNND